jgi:PAS domain-containing protein
MSKPRATFSKFLHILLIVLGGFSLPLYMLEAKKLSREREEFAFALIAADAGRWYWDLEQDKLYWDDQMFVLFGHSRENWSPSYNGFESTLLPEDVNRVNNYISSAIKNRTGYQDIFRVIGSDGEVRAIRASGRVNPTGKYMTGICLPAIHKSGEYIPPKTSSILRSRGIPNRVGSEPPQGTPLPDALLQVSDFEG